MGSAGDQDANGDDDGPDILAFFRGEHLLRKTLQLRLLFFVGRSGFHLGNPQYLMVAGSSESIKNYFIKICKYLMVAQPTMHPTLRYCHVNPNKNRRRERHRFRVAAIQLIDQYQNRQP